MRIPHRVPFSRGYTPLVSRSGPTAEMLMDFGVINLKGGECWEAFSKTDEQCLLLLRGGGNIRWTDPDAENLPPPQPDPQTGFFPGLGQAFRSSLFDESPWCLSVPRETKVSLYAGPLGAEWLYLATDNRRYFTAKLYRPDECQSEFRGQGTMRETSTRIVRTVFDASSRSESNLVIGEVINMPGKWSSYPPHHHPQPEIYHYRFQPEQGFGLTAIGDTPHIIQNRDTILIRGGEVHPQVTAPGYAMWYLWAIRHLENAYYGQATKTPIFVDEHTWVTEDENAIWQAKRSEPDEANKTVNEANETKEEARSES